MELFGKACYAYYQGDKTDFFFKDQNNGMWNHDLHRYFRKPEEFSVLEKQLIGMAEGRILDIGCATGYYIPELMKKGETTGIDVCELNIKIAHENGLNNCFFADVFEYNPDKKFDTITLIENNIGMGGSVEKTDELFKKIISLLNENGKILAIVREIYDRDYTVNELQPVWKEQTGPVFKWILFNINYLTKMARNNGLNMQVIMRDGPDTLVKLTK